MYWAYHDLTHVFGDLTDMKAGLLVTWRNNQEGDRDSLPKYL